MNRLDAGLAAINAAVHGDTDPKHLLVAAKCRGLLAGYDARWKDAVMDVLDVERVVTANLYNIETERQSRTFRIAGKLDVRAMRRGRLLIIDHKTTSESIDDPSAPYWRQLVIESQPSHYMWLEHMNGVACDEAMWDVVRKPTISPKQVTKADSIATLQTRFYFGVELADVDKRELSETGRESLGMYSARLARDCTETRPEWYFQRRTIPRLENEMAEYARELWEHSQEIIHARATRRWARNSGACMLYGSPCEYLGLCSGHDSPDSGNWQRRGNVHEELPELAGDGRDVITNSRVRCFQTCRRKHLYHYEMGLERIHAEEREALWFGALWHKAQEVWWFSASQETTQKEVA